MPTTVHVHNRQLWRKTSFVFGSVK